MSDITDEYEMEAGTSGLLETCDDSRMLIESVGTIVGENNTDEKYFVVTTDVDEEQENLIQIAETEEELNGNSLIEENRLWDLVCRICANTSDHLIPIFKGEGLEHEFDNKIQRYLPIRVSEEDNLPLHLCYHCAATLLAWHELADGCLEAEQRLIQMQNESRQKNQSNTLGESLDDRSEAASPEDTAVSTETLSRGEDLAVKGKHREDSSADDNERLEGEDYTESAKLNRAEIEEPHPEEKQEYFECGECGGTFIEILDLVAHLNYEHKVSVHYCSYCDSVYKGNLEDFKQHEETHTINIKADKQSMKHSVSCSLCNKDCNTIEELKYHLREHMFIKHSPKDTKPKSYTCNSCLQSFSRKYDLRRHLRSYERAGYIDNDEEIESLNNAKVWIGDGWFYECNTCGKQIVTKRGFIRHIRIHTGNRPCKCDVCGNQYRIKQDLVRHIRDVHERIKKYVCEICGRPFANKGAKEDHQRIHTGERPYSCKLCKKTFRTLNSVYVHNRTHTNYRPHKCTTCDKQFASKQRLNNHMTIHTGIKEFSCEICLKLFSVKGELVRHRATHSEHKPFNCTCCGLKFGLKRYLRNHIRQHHREQSSSLLDKLTEATH